MYKYGIPLILTLLLPFSASGYTMNGSFEDLGGFEREFSGYEGKPLFVDTFATWCRPCQDSMPHLEVLYQSLDEEASMLSISIDPSYDNPGKVEVFRSDFTAPWDWGIDVNFDFQNQYSTPIIPTLYLFDPDGVLVKKWEGITPTSEIINDLPKNYNITLSVKEKGLTELLGTQVLQNQLFQLTIGTFLLIGLYLILVPRPKS